MLTWPLFLAWLCIGIALSAWMSSSRKFVNKQVIIAFEVGILFAVASGYMTTLLYNEDPSKLALFHLLSMAMAFLCSLACLEVLAYYIKVVNEEQRNKNPIEVLFLYTMEDIAICNRSQIQFFMASLDIAGQQSLLRQSSYEVFKTIYQEYLDKLEKTD